MIGYVKAMDGHKDEAWQVIRQIENQAKLKDIERTNLAYIYIALGEKEKAFEYLEEAFLQYSTDLLAVKVDPRLKPLRQDPRFQDLVRRIGLPAS